MQKYHVDILKLVSLCYQQLGYQADAYNLSGFVELLDMYPLADLYAAAHVILGRAWDRPPQPGDFLQVLREAERYQQWHRYWHEQHSKEVSWSIPRWPR
jgi:hypothetical protein